jgi:hypothetical protein
VARELRWWVVGTLATCLALACIYLPPRGRSLWLRERAVTMEPESPYRLHERALAQRLRRVEAEVQLLEARAEVDTALARRRAEGVPGPVVLFSGDTLPVAVRRGIAAELDTVWRRLGLGVTKVGVGVLLDVQSWRQSSNTKLYLLPDSTDRTTCLAQLPAGSWIRAVAADESADGPSHRRAWLESGFGPCAFYAAFGAPGSSIGRWLSARQYDLTLSPAWRSLAIPERSAASGSPAPTNLQRESWFRAAPYRLPPRALGCLARREASCSAQVLAGRGNTDSIQHLVSIGMWRWDPPALLGAEHYLADVVSTIGRDRFQHFWNSELPVDTALAEALRMPVGEWTRRWEGGLAPEIRLGPAPPLSAVLLGLVLATLAVGWVTRTVRRREVR